MRCVLHRNSNRHLVHQEASLNSDKTSNELRRLDCHRESQVQTRKTGICDRLSRYGLHPLNRALTGGSFRLRWSLHSMHLRGVAFRRRWVQCTTINPGRSPAQIQGCLRPCLWHQNTRSLNVRQVGGCPVMHSHLRRETPQFVISLASNRNSNRGK